MADVNGLDLTNWRDNRQPLLRGKPFVELDEVPPVVSRSLAVRGDREGFILGMQDFLVAFGSDGTQRWNQPGIGEAWGVNFACGGDPIIAAYGDGTIRRHRWSDGKQLLALFVDKDDKRWVARTPTGNYMASPGGEDLIGWQINRRTSSRPRAFATASTGPIS